MNSHVNIYKTKHEQVDYKRHFKKPKRKKLRLKLDLCTGIMGSKHQTHMIFSFTIAL